MARRQRSKTRKYAGNRTFGGGNKKNRRGKGSRGGVGRGGYHKHRWFHTLKYEGKTRSEKGFTNPTKSEFEEVKLDSISRQISQGKIQKQPDGAFHLDYTAKGKKVKVLGNGVLSEKLSVKAHAFSASAKEKIEKAGGNAELFVFEKSAAKQ